MIPVESHGNVGLKDNAQIVLWNKSDYDAVKKFYDRCNLLTCNISARTNIIKSLRSLVYFKTINPMQQKQLDLQISKYFEEFNELTKLVDQFESKVYNYKYSDKKSGFRLDHGKIVEPQTIAINDNTLVNPALVIYAKQIANFSIEEFRYIASGTGSLPTTPNQNRLQSENSRLDIFINGGFRNPNGDVVREGVIFPPGLDDALVTEFGSFTMPTQEEGDMQWRNVIDNVAEQIDHDQGNTFYSIAHVTILQINYIND
jgi:hypothetical protein